MSCFDVFLFEQQAYLFWPSHSGLCFEFLCWVGCTQVLCFIYFFRLYCAFLPFSESTFGSLSLTLFHPHPWKRQKEKESLIKSSEPPHHKPSSYNGRGRSESTAQCKQVHSVIYCASIPLGKQVNKCSLFIVDVMLLQACVWESVCQVHYVLVFAVSDVVQLT